MRIQSENTTGSIIDIQSPGQHQGASEIGIIVFSKSTTGIQLFKLKELQ